MNQKNSVLNKNVKRSHYTSEVCISNILSTKKSTRCIGLPRISMTVDVDTYSQRISNWSVHLLPRRVTPPTRR